MSKVTGNEPDMCGTTSNVVESFKFLRQQCNLYFSVKGIIVEKQAILLLAGEYLKHFNSWMFDNKAKK